MSPIRSSFTIKMRSAVAGTRCDPRIIRWRATMHWTRSSWMKMSMMLRRTRAVGRSPRTKAWIVEKNWLDTTWTSLAPEPTSRMKRFMSNGSRQEASPIERREGRCDLDRIEENRPTPFRSSPRAPGTTPRRRTRAICQDDRRRRSPEASKKRLARPRPRGTDSRCVLTVGDDETHVLHRSLNQPGVFEAVGRGCHILTMYVTGIGNSGHHFHRQCHDPFRQASAAMHHADSLRRDDATQSADCPQIALKPIAAEHSPFL